MANAPGRKRRLTPLPPPLDRLTIQRMVFETFDRRRFLQDSPIRPDVWFRAIAIADQTARWRVAKNERAREARSKERSEDGKGERPRDATSGRAVGQPDDRIDVLITPVSGTGAGVVAERLRSRFNEALRYQTPPPGPIVVDALVWRRLGVDPPPGSSQEVRADAFAQVASWAGLAADDQQDALHERIGEELREILPNGRWKNADELRYAIRYALQTIVGRTHAPELFGQRQHIAQGMREVAANLSFPEIYKHVLPLTGWWSKLPKDYRDEAKVKKAIRGDIKSSADTKMTAAQFVSSRSNPEFYRVSALAAFVTTLYDCADREAYEKWRGVVDVLAPATPRDIDEDAGLFDPDVSAGKAAVPSMKDQRVVDLLTRCADMDLPHDEGAPDPAPRPDQQDRAAETKGIVWAIQCNRRALAPEADHDEDRPSHATVKADAARRLFGISTSRITWAVIDTGIDLRHAAFRTPSWTKAKPTTRIARVLDFALLRAIMSERVLPQDLPSWPQDGDDAETLRTDRLDILQAIDFVMQRNRLARDLDWNIVAPLIARPASASDKRWTAPTNDHGTHVAGILAGDWRVQRVVADDVEPDKGSSAGAADAAAQERKEVRLTGLQDEGDALVARGVASAKTGKSYESGLRVGEDREIFVGVCPDLRIIDLRVFGDDRPADSGKAASAGSGASTEYSILAAIEYIGWLNRTHETPVVHGVNLSLAVPHRVDAYACGQTPICRACNSLSAAGTVVVAAAGNSGFEIEAGKLSRGDGYRDISISDPGNAEEVITVGATHARDPHTYGVSYFSGRGPTGDGRRKPDLVAPGERILSAILWAAVDDKEPREPEADYEDERLDYKDGTSMAAPHVSGAAALLMARYPELVGQPRRIKQILMRTATDLGRDPVFQGAGLVDVLRALQSV